MAAQYRMPGEALARAMTASLWMHTRALRATIAKWNQRALNRGGFAAIPRSIEVFNRR
jgi:hypothetical protein